VQQHEQNAKNLKSRTSCTKTDRSSQLAAVDEIKSTATCQDSFGHSPGPSQSFQPRPDLASTGRTGRKEERGHKMRRLDSKLENNNSLRLRTGGLPN
ncbi:hypothetical protein PHISCL_06201, partial [Aspergillus sclerotialis]